MSNNRKTPPVSSNIYLIGPNGELYHHGIKGQKWGIRRYQNPDGTLTNAGKARKTKMSYEDKVRAEIEEYHKAHPQRSQKDNYTIALRNIARREGEKMMKRQLAGMALMPVFGLGMPVVLGNIYVSQKKNNVLESIKDEYNIERAKRVVNM